MEEYGKLRLALQLVHMLSLMCRATFDTDNIDIGPERRNYLDHRLSRVWEMNSEVRALILHLAPLSITSPVMPLQ